MTGGARRCQYDRRVGFFPPSAPKRSGRPLPQRSTLPPSAATVLGVDLGIVLVHHELDADPRRALFPCLGKKNHVASSATPERFNRSIVINAAVTLSLSSTVPRPYT